jgi:hypothetical protein
MPTQSTYSTTSTRRHLRDFFPDLRTDAMKLHDQKNMEEALAEGYQDRAAYEQLIATQRSQSIDSQRS